MSQIQWFPGHMAKTRRLITDNLKLVDIVIEVLDARIPISSKNPIIDELLGDKPRLVILNKSDLSDEKINSLWIEYFNKKTSKAILFNSISNKGNQVLLNKIREILKEKIERQHNKGIVNRSIKIMVVGIPNVGKSSLINCLAGKKTMKVEDRPGVTKSKQWIKISDGCELLDTPGILWPKFEDKRVALNLAFCGAIKDDIMDIEEICVELLLFLKDNYKEFLEKRYNIEALDGEEGYQLFNKIGTKRGFLISGGEIDTQRTAKIILDEFRGIKIGKISLEKPGDLGGL